MRRLHRLTRRQWVNEEAYNCESNKIKENQRMIIFNMANGGSESESEREGMKANIRDEGGLFVLGALLVLRLSLQGNP